MRLLPLLGRDGRGSAAVETALVAPLFAVLIFGSYELGRYFLYEHVVVKAVRDGARYASRLPFTDYDCSSVTSAGIASIRNVTRTGQVLTGGTPRLANWTDDSTITISVACDTSVTTGIYSGMAGGAPVVTVAAAVPYTKVFPALSFSGGSMLNAHAQASVTGL